MKFNDKLENVLMNEQLKYYYKIPYCIDKPEISNKIKNNYIVFCRFSDKKCYFKSKINNKYFCNAYFYFKKFET